MAMTTNAQNTYAQVGIREDLKDVVYRIDPEEVPFQSNISTSGTATNTYKEWQVQELASPSKTNQQLEGRTYSAAAVTARTRMGNRCQISDKVFAVTNTGQAVDVAGVTNEYDEQMVLKAIELKRDMEVSLLDNNAQAAGGTTTVRETAGLATFLTNVDMTGVQDYTAATGDGTDAWNLSGTTARALTLTILNSAMKSAYIDGGKPTMIMLSPTQTVNFTGLALASSISGAAQVRYNLSDVEAAAIIGSVEGWRSDFGGVKRTINVQMASDTAFLDDAAFLIDPRFAEVAFLREIQEVDLPEVADSNEGVVRAEYTLCVGAPKAHAGAFVLS